MKQREPPFFALTTKLDDVPTGPEIPCSDDLDDLTPLSKHRNSPADVVCVVHAPLAIQPANKSSARAVHARFPQPTAATAASPLLTTAASPLAGTAASSLPVFARKSLSPASPLPPELVVPPLPWPPDPVTPPVVVPPAPPLTGAQHCCIAQVQPTGQSEEDVQPVLLVPPVAVVPPLPPAPLGVVPLPPLPELPAKPPPVPGGPPRALPPVDAGASVEMAASDDEALPLLPQPVPANGSVQPTTINHQGVRRGFISQVSTRTPACTGGRCETANAS